LGIEAIRTDGVFFTIVMEVSKDVKPGISPIKFESFGATADNDMNEMTPKLVEVKWKLLKHPLRRQLRHRVQRPDRVQVAVRVLPVRTAVSNANANGNGKPSTTPKTTEQPHEDIPQSGGTGEHAPFLKGYPGDCSSLRTILQGGSGSYLCQTFRCG